MSKKYPVITIGREYCTGSEDISRILSERLGIPYYNKDLVKKAAAESGFTPEEVEVDGESISFGSSMLEGFLKSAGPNAFRSSYDQIYEAQKKAILELAESPCIILGRCSDHILKEAGIKALNVFLYADAADRVARAEALGKGRGAEAIKVVAERDARRRAYYQKYTGTRHGDYRNYHIMLDTSLIGVSGCVDIIAGLAEQMAEE